MEIQEIVTSEEYIGVATTGLKVGVESLIYDDEAEPEDIELALEELAKLASCKRDSIEPGPIRDLLAKYVLIEEDGTLPKSRREILTEHLDEWEEQFRKQKEEEDDESDG